MGFGDGVENENKLSEDFCLMDFSSHFDMKMFSHFITWVIVHLSVLYGFKICDRLYSKHWVRSFRNNDMLDMQL